MKIKIQNVQWVQFLKGTKTHDGCHKVRKVLGKQMVCTQCMTS